MMRSIAIKNAAFSPTVCHSIFKCILSSRVETAPIVILSITILEFLHTFDNIGSFLKALPIYTDNIRVPKFFASFNDHSFSILLLFCSHFHHLSLPFSIPFIFFKYILLINFKLHFLTLTLEILELRLQVILLHSGVLLLIFIF